MNLKTRKPRLLAFTGLLVILSLALAACAPGAVETTQEVPVTGGEDMEATMPVTGDDDMSMTETPQVGGSDDSGEDSMDDSDGSGDGDDAMGESDDDMASGSVELGVSQTAELGEFLVDQEGMTLYMFTNDTPNTSNCSGDCLVNWPPLVAEGEPMVADGVDQSKLGTTTLADGREIVTYDGMPLYYFIGDTNPGDVNGQNVNGVWFVVAP